MFTRKGLNHIHDRHFLIKQDATVEKTIQEENNFSL